MRLLYIADTLSRAFLSDQGLKSDVEFEYAIHALTKYLPVSEQRKSQFKKEIQNDYQLKLVKTFCERGWPANQHQIPDCVKHFAKIKNEVVIVTNVLLMFPITLNSVFEPDQGVWLKNLIV
ncbi:hypothetical protein QE152_g4966 [Popillia japonica]|uniref:Uncharacterized protein n=1 Tax=Popillia japonica TaxID=7064 RepID=A0AAW1MQW1_POPJA